MQASTLVIRLVHDPANGVSGVVERVRTGVKHRFEGKEALYCLLEELFAQDGASVAAEIQPTTQGEEI